VALPFGSTAFAGIVSKRLGSTYLGQLNQPLVITQRNNEKSPDVCRSGRQTISSIQTIRTTQ
jgi:hypothetical protein